MLIYAHITGTESNEFIRETVKTQHFRFQLNFFIYLIQSEKPETYEKTIKNR